MDPFFLQFHSLHHNENPTSHKPFTLEYSSLLAPDSTVLFIYTEQCVCCTFLSFDTECTLPTHKQQQQQLYRLLINIISPTINTPHHLRQLRLHPTLRTALEDSNVFWKTKNPFSIWKLCCIRPVSPLSGQQVNQFGSYELSCRSPSRFA